MRFDIPTSIAEQERGLERMYTDMSEEKALLKPSTLVGFSQASLLVPENAKITPITPTSDLPVGLSLGDVVVSDVPQFKLYELNPFSQVVAERKMSL